MKARKIKENVYRMGAVDWNRRLFDALVQIPDGTSYNAYLIRGSEKTVLLDTVDPSMLDVLMMQLERVEKIDYIVAHHAEQDHSGSLPQVIEKYKNAQVITTPQGKEMLVDLLCLPEERIITVDDGETLSLGDKTLEFIYTPWVHWPETMSTFLQEDKILFSCDFFGSHLATTDLFVTDETRVFVAAKRYYAEIMMPFRTIIQKNLEKIGNYTIDFIAPSHGPIYNRPSFIIDAYRDWTSATPKNAVVLPYTSMHGSTKTMVDYLVNALVEQGVTVHPFELTVTDVGELAMTLVDAATIVIGTPTVNVGPHPLVFSAANLVNSLRPNLKFAALIVSYGWYSKAVDQITGLISNLQVEILDPVLCKGCPKEANFKDLDRLATNIAEKHQEHNFS